MAQMRSTIWKVSDHDRQRQDHKQELIKPFLRNGEPNPAFIEQYPEESKEIYKFIPTEQEILENERKDI